MTDVLGIHIIDVNEKDERDYESRARMILYNASSILSSNNYDFIFYYWLIRD